MTQKHVRKNLIQSVSSKIGAGLLLFFLSPWLASLFQFEHIVSLNAWAQQADSSEEIVSSERHRETKGTAIPEASTDKQDQAMPLVHEELKSPKAPWEKEKSVESRAISDAVHGAISKGVLATAEWLDSFFDDPRYAREVNRSRVKVRLDTFFEENEPVDFRTKISVKLVLPKMKRKARLVISGDPDEQLEEGAPTKPITTPPVPSLEEDNVTAAFQYVSKDTKRRNYSARVGVRFRDVSPQAFLGPRYRVLVPIDSWDLRFTQEVLWWTDRGWESKTRIDFEHEFRNRLFVRTTADGFWTEGENGYFYYLGMFIRQPLSPRRALSYEWFNYFKTRPEHVLNEVAVAIRFRQKLWRDWLYYEIAPQARFPREEGFDLIPGILFRLEFIFGRYQEERV